MDISHPEKNVNINLQATETGHSRASSNSLSAPALPSSPMNLQVFMATGKSGPSRGLQTRSDRWFAAERNKVWNDADENEAHNLNVALHNEKHTSSLSRHTTNYGCEKTERNREASSLYLESAIFGVAATGTSALQPCLKGSGVSPNLHVPS